MRIFVAAVGGSGAHPETRMRKGAGLGGPVPAPRR
jgi:hypothetical protein